MHSSHPLHQQTIMTHTPNTAPFTLFPKRMTELTRDEMEIDGPLTSTIDTLSDEPFIIREGRNILVGPGQYITLHAGQTVTINDANPNHARNVVCIPKDVEDLSMRSLNKNAEFLNKYKKGIEAACIKRNGIISRFAINEDTTMSLLGNPNVTRQNIYDNCKKNFEEFEDFLINDKIQRYNFDLNIFNHISNHVFGENMHTYKNLLENYCSLKEHSTLSKQLMEPQELTISEQRNVINFQKGILDQQEAVIVEQTRLINQLRESTFVTPNKRTAPTF